MGYSTRSKVKTVVDAAPVKPLLKKAKTAGAAASKPVKPAKQSAGPLESFPDVRVLNEKGDEVMSTSVCAEKNVVVFLYPRANTPGCTKQACGLNDNYALFERHGFAVCGLSYDKPKSQSNWASKYGLNFSFLCDTEGGELIKKLGCAKAPKSIKRSHFVVEKGGRILDAQIQVSPGDSISKAVDFVSSYKGQPAAPEAEHANGNNGPHPGEDAKDQDAATPGEGDSAAADPAPAASTAADPTAADAAAAAAPSAAAESAAANSTVTADPSRAADANLAAPTSDGATPTEPPVKDSSA